MFFCTQCNQEIEATSKFCTNCGVENRLYQEDTALREQNMSYFKKHWQGKLSLGISYWINNILFKVILEIVLLLVIEKIDFTNNAMFPSLSIITLLIIVFFITTPWVLIGLWRSANNHIKKYNVNFWANVVRILVVFGWIQSAFLFINSGFPQIVEFSKIALGKDSIPKYRINILNNGSELEILGGIKFGLTNDVKEYFHKYSNIRVIHLNSSGGRIQEAQKLSKFLEDKEISTYTSSGCHSACVDIFMSGKYRFINNYADLGFHQPSFPGMLDEDLQDAINEGKKYLAKKGVKEEFIERAFSIPSDDLWEPTHAELKESGIIHKVVDGSEFAITDLYAFTDIKEIEEALLQESLLQIIKRFEPNIFERIVKSIDNSIKNGETKTEMFLKTRIMVRDIYLKYLPYSSNEVILKNAQLFLDSVKVIYKHDPIQAYYMSMGIADKFNPKTYLPKEFEQKELNIKHEVIVSGASNPQQIPTEQEITEIRDIVTQKLYEKIGDKLTILDNLTSKNVNKAEASRVIILFYEEIFRLEHDKKIKLLRFMYGSLNM